jgi:predicted nuclease of predicted toxin-antitoxin system
VRWLADECVAASVVANLRAAGHDVSYMAEIAPAAIDTEAISRAHRDDRLLLTEDKDFGELIFRWNWSVPGLVFLRIAPDKNLLKWQRLNAAIGRFEERLYGRYTVVEEARSRLLVGTR